MRTGFYLLAAFTAFFLLHSCRNRYITRAPETKNIFISWDSLQVTDTSVLRIIAPYKTKVDSLMSEQLVWCEEELKKELPAGTLNNAMCDLLQQHVVRTGKYKEVICVMNYGGIRIPSIGKGMITVGKIFELMPFDNELLLAKVSGKAVSELAAWMAKRGGDPVSGMRMHITQQQSTDITVNGKMLAETGIYYVLLSDYMVSGGDGFGFIRQQALELIPLRERVRDALLDELRYMRGQGQTLKAVNDGRIEKN